jgi:hypothetical protein
MSNVVRLFSKAGLPGRPHAGESTEELKAGLDRWAINLTALEQALWCMTVKVTLPSEPDGKLTVAVTNRRMSQMQARARTEFIMRARANGVPEVPPHLVS